MTPTDSLRPSLPDNWKSYTFAIQYKGRELQIKVSEKQTSIQLLDGDNLTVKVYNENYVLQKDSSF